MSSNEYMRRYMIERYRQRKLKAIVFLGGKCLFCGTNKELEFDHIECKNKNFTIAKLWSVSSQRFWKEIEKCQLLCRRCHTKKTIKDLGLRQAKGKHGTISTVRYCKCTLCKDAKNKWMRSFYFRNKDKINSRRKELRKIKKESLAKLVTASSF